MFLVFFNTIRLFLRGVAQSGSAPGLGPGGRRFESFLPDHLFMSIVYKICITDKSGKEMIEISSVEAVSGNGLVGDRYFNKNNDADIQLTLIESENIEHYNSISGTNIPYIDFRRNIITKGIQLNKLIGKELLIGKVRVKAHRLCNPCRYLQEKLKQEKLVKNITNKGGLRCEILTDGIISINDGIKIFN